MKHSPNQGTGWYRILGVWLNESPWSLHTRTPISRSVPALPHTVCLGGSLKE
jgi:hypothetical protein